MSQKIFKITSVIILSLLVISSVILFIILFRPFYYWHINFLNLPETTKWTYAEIKQAYDEMMNYCVFYHPFSTGVMNFSSMGMQHFRDCQILFTINNIIFAISMLWFIFTRKKFKNIPSVKYKVMRCSGVVNICAFGGIGILAAIAGFENAFTWFHKILFYGKDNWLFYPSVDEIIQVLPETFFMNCGIFIVAAIMSISVLLIVFGNLGLKKKCTESI